MAGFLGWLVDSAVESAGKATGEVLNGVGEAAIKLRTAITGDLPPEKKAEVELKFIELENALLISQNELNKLDAQSGSLFKGGWRPFTGWTCAFGFGYTSILRPILAWVSTNVGWQTPPNIDSDLLIWVLCALLGIAATRSFEKNKGLTR